MTRKKIKFSTVAAGLALVSIALPGHADSNIRYELDELVALGNGCRTEQGDVGDTRATLRGSVLVALFQNLQVSLGGGSSELADRAACSVRIPVSLARGVYISRLEGTLTTSVHKEAGATGALSFAVAYFSTSPLTATANFERGEVRHGEFKLTKVFAAGDADLEKWKEALCGARDSEGLFALNIGLTAGRNNAGDAVTIDARGSSGGSFELVAQTASCSQADQEAIP